MVDSGERLRDSLSTRALILGIDRLDYSKGIPNRLRGFAQLLKRFPEHRSRVTLLQVAPVSRGDVATVVAAPVAIGVTAGALLGSRILPHANVGALRILFATILVLIAVEMGWRAMSGI